MAGAFPAPVSARYGRAVPDPLASKIAPLWLAERCHRHRELVVSQKLMVTSDRIYTACDSIYSQNDLTFTRL
jgi:hypothetical protein